MGDSQRTSEQAVWGEETPRSKGPKWRKAKRFSSSSHGYMAIFLKNRRGEGQGVAGARY